MKSAVLDSYAIIAYLFKETGFAKVVSLLEHGSEGEVRILMAAPNWAELRYILARRLGEAEWVTLRSKLMALPFEVVAADRLLAEKAGEFKATKKMSLADCFAAALAREHNAAVYTGDPEFKEVQDDIEIVWIGPR